MMERRGEDNDQMSGKRTLNIHHSRPKSHLLPHQLVPGEPLSSYSLQMKGTGTDEQRRGKKNYMHTYLLSLTYGLPQQRINGKKKKISLLCMDDDEAFLGFNKPRFTRFAHLPFVYGIPLQVNTLL